MTPLLTVMLPSRGRICGLCDTINSFVNNAKDSDSVEFIVKFDLDDVKSIRQIEDFRKDINIKFLIGPRLNGYESIHTFCNEMLHLASGLWITLGNDDAQMVTPHWDEILGKEELACMLLNPNDENGNHCHLFPIVNREICLEIGYFSMNAFTDRWLQNIYMPLGMTKDIPIRICHEIKKDQSSEDRAVSPVYSWDEWDKHEETRESAIRHLKINYT